MKKFNFVKIISLVFVCALVLGAFAFTTFATEATDDSNIAIVSQNAFFGDKIQLMYAIQAPAGATMTAVDTEGNTINVLPFTDENGNTTVNIGGTEYPMYILETGVAAQAIDEVITLTVTYGDVTVSKSYSVLQYVYERMNLKNIATGAELAMFEALLAYADAANAFLDDDTTSFGDYVYVTVVDGTIDGDNATGMFLPGATPFANIAANADYDSSAYNVEWDVSVNGAEAVRYTNDQIKTLEITDKTTVTRVLVESECAHEWSEATCTTLSTCSKCKETTGVLAEHAWGDWDVTNATCTTDGSKTRECAVCEKVETETIESSGTHTDANGDLACDTCEKVLFEKLTITFDNTSKRTELSTTKQVWKENGIVFTNNKGSSTSDVIDSSNPVRCYKGSTITIDCVGMSKITIKCSGTDYAGISAADIGSLSKNGTTFTIVFDNSVNTVKLTSGNSQTRINSIEIIVAVCDHANTYDVEEVPATCTADGTTAGTMCSDCGRAISGVEKINALGHSYDDGAITTAATCTTAGVKTFTCEVCDATTTESIKALGHTTDNGVCERCNETIEGTDTEPTWQLATDISVGDTIVIVCTSKKMELTSVGTAGSYGSGTAYTSTPSGKYTLTVVAGSTSGTYAFKDSNGKYLSWSSSNSLTLSTTLNANSSWKVTFSNGTAKILNAKDNTRSLQWNASSPRFAAYTSSQTAVAIYVLK